MNSFIHSCLRHTHESGDAALAAAAAAVVAADITAAVAAVASDITTATVAVAAAAAVAATAAAAAPTTAVPARRYFRGLAYAFAFASGDWPAPDWPVPLLLVLPPSPRCQGILPSPPRQGIIKGPRKPRSDREVPVCCGSTRHLTDNVPSLSHQYVHKQCTSDTHH
jgi:hypothetical protein